MLSQYGQYTLHVFVVFVVVFSACMWLPFGIFSTKSVFLRIACVIVGILAVFLLFNKDIYLPFLAATKFPDGLIPVTQENKRQISEAGEIHVPIHDLPPFAKVIYWAAEDGDPRQPSVVQNAKDAYGEYLNSGVLVADGNGVAIVVIRCPQNYQVWKFKLHKHLHYRYVSGKGMLSPIHTKKIEC